MNQKWNPGESTSTVLSQLCPRTGAIPPPVASQELSANGTTFDLQFAEHQPGCDSDSGETPGETRLLPGRGNGDDLVRLNMVEPVDLRDLYTPRWAMYRTMLQPWK